MIKLRVDWHQACPSCGTEVVVDFLNQYSREYPCPWCGAPVRIEISNGSPEARRRLTSALKELEAQINTDFVGR